MKTGITDSNIEKVSQYIADNIFISPDIPIEHIEGIKLTANFWKLFFVYMIFGLLWSFYFSNNIIVAYIPLVIAMIVLIKFINKKHVLEINEQYIKYKNTTYNLDDIIHIYQHPIIKSKVNFYHKTNKNFLMVESFMLRNEAEAYYLSKIIKNCKLKRN